MSELKDYDIMDIEAMDDERLEKSESGKIQVTCVYIKSEADKVIAELKESHKNEVKQLLILNSEQANAANGLRNSMEQVIFHHKYKRCLWLARWCASRSASWLLDPANDELYKSDFYDKWKKRWLELAEKFKEAK